MPANGEGQNAQNRRTVTTPPHVRPMGGTGTDGEVGGSGAMYSGFLNERENKSNPRNTGPSRPYGAIGASKIPAASMSSRQTGRTS